MHRFCRHSLLCPLLGIGLILLAACDQLRMPRFTHEPEQASQIPIAVKLAFDESVPTALLQQTVCADTLWQGRLGNAIVTAFEQEGKRHFARVVVESPGAVATSAAGPAPNLTVHLRLLQKDFEATNRTGSSDQYLARLTVQLGSAYQNAAGQTLTEGPLTYSDNISLWTPQLGSGGTQCVTGQLDAALTKAAEHLAGQMVKVVTALVTQTAQPATSPAAGGAPNPSFGLAPSGLSGANTLSFRATLLDENDNQILESAEKIGVRVDATNTGAVPISAAAITLTGTPALIDAFTSTFSSPMQMGPIQPGETKAAIVWGRMPANVEARRGELTVSVVPAGGPLGTAAASPAPQTLIAAIRPAVPGRSSVQGSPADRSSATTQATAPSDRYAVIVGLTQYRTPWPGWLSRRSPRIEDVSTVLRQSWGISQDRALILRDESATRADIDEALALWLPERISRDSLIVFYFGGAATVDPKTGEAFLIPYDGSPTSSPFRLLSVRFLQGRLKNLGVRLALAVIDAPITPPSGNSMPRNSKTRPAKAPNWGGDFEGPGRIKSGRVIQIVRMDNGSGHPRGFWDGWPRQADADHNGTVTVGEWLRSLRGAALIFPNLPATAPELAIELTGTDSSTPRSR